MSRLFLSFALVFASRLLYAYEAPVIVPRFSVAPIYTQACLRDVTMIDPHLSKLPPLHQGVTNGFAQAVVQVDYAFQARFSKTPVMASPILLDFAYKTKDSTPSQRIWGLKRNLPIYDPLSGRSELPSELSLRNLLDLGGDPEGAMEILQKMPKCSQEHLAEVLGLAPKATEKAIVARLEVFLAFLRIRHEKPKSEWPNLSQDPSLEKLNAYMKTHLYRRHGIKRRHKATLYKYLRDTCKKQPQRGIKLEGPHKSFTLRRPESLIDQLHSAFGGEPFFPLVVSYQVNEILGLDEPTTAFGVIMGVRCLGGRTQLLLRNSIGGISWDGRFLEGTELETEVLRAHVQGELDDAPEEIRSLIRGIGDFWVEAEGFLSFAPRFYWFSLSPNY